MKGLWGYSYLRRCATSFLLIFQKHPLSSKHHCLKEAVGNHPVVPCSLVALWSILARFLIAIPDIGVLISNSHSMTPQSQCYEPKKLKLRALSPQIHSHSRTPSPSTIADYPTEIIPGLYISDIYCAEDPHVLASLGITHVVSAMCGTVVIPSHLSIQHCRIPLVDSPFSELAGFLPASTSFLQEALGDSDARVLVHCFRGVSRSASVVAAFLISEYGWTSSQAVNYVKLKRSIVEPNPGFLSQLNEYAQTLRVSS